MCRYKNNTVKQVRYRAHRLFDQLWKSPPDGCRLMTRFVAYRNLQRWMKKTKDEAHIALFTKRECFELIDRLEEYGLKDPLNQPKKK